MKGFALIPTLAWLSLALGGLLSYLCNTGMVPTIAPDLQLLQAEMGPVVRNYEIPVEAAILGDLPPERFTFQSIAGPEGQEGRLYVAYYKRSRRWSGRPHDLDICYRSMGYSELETEQWEVPGGGLVWGRVFEKPDRKVRVVHWLQNPGLAPGPDSVIKKISRLTTAHGLRQDIASIYMEFDYEGAPSKEALSEAAQAVIDDVESLWR